MADTLSNSPIFAQSPKVDRRAVAALLDSPNESLVDLVDSLLDKGVVLDGEIVLGLADVDLIYVRLSAVVAAADKILPPRE